MSSPQEPGDKSPSPTEPSVAASGGPQPSENSAGTSSAAASVSHDDDGAMMSSPESDVGARKKHGSKGGMHDQVNRVPGGPGEANGQVLMEDVTSATEQPQEALSRYRMENERICARIEDLLIQLPKISLTLDCRKQIDELKESLASKADVRRVEAAVNQASVDIKELKIMMSNTETEKRKLQSDKDKLEQTLKSSRKERKGLHDEVKDSRQLNTKLMQLVQELEALLKEGHHQIGHGVGCIVMVTTSEDSTVFEENSRARKDCKRLHAIFNQFGIATDEPQVVRTRDGLLQKLQDVKSKATHEGVDPDGLFICIYHLGCGETIVTSEGSADEVDVRSQFDDVDELKDKTIVLLFQPLITDVADQDNTPIPDQGTQPSPAISSNSRNRVSAPVEETPLGDQLQRLSTASEHVTHAVQETALAGGQYVPPQRTMPTKSCFFVIHALPQQVHDDNQSCANSSLRDLFEAWASAPHVHLEKLLTTDQLPRRYKWDSPLHLFLKRSFRQPLPLSDLEEPWKNKSEVYAVEGGEGLILNCHYDGTEYADLPEGQKNAEDLGDLFCDLGLHTVVMTEPLSKAKIMVELWSLKHRLEEAFSKACEQPVCLWLAILSHGRKDLVIASDGETISEDDIMDVFVSGERSCLEKKLKLFIFDKCRSDGRECGSPAPPSKKEHPRQTEALSAQPHSPINPCASSQSTAVHCSPPPTRARDVLPRSNRRRQDRCDIVIIHSTSYGMTALSTPQEEVTETCGEQELGSWFVQPFIKHCRATRQGGPELIGNILRKTKRDMIQRRSMTTSGDVVYQTPETINRGDTKNVYIQLVN